MDSGVEDHRSEIWGDMTYGVEYINGILYARGYCNSDDYWQSSSSVTTACL